MTDSDVDSDEEIRRMVAAQDASHAVLRQEVDEDNLEVVGLDYLTKSDCSCQQQKGNGHFFIDHILFHQFPLRMSFKIGFEEDLLL